MSKSFDWAIARARSQHAPMLNDRKWEDAKELDAKYMFNSTFAQQFNIAEVVCEDIEDAHFRIISGDNKEFFVHIKLDPNSNYKYFTSETQLNDGTLSFCCDAIRSLATKVVCLGTADNDLIKDGINFTNVNWTVGNFVVLNEFVPELAPKEKPYLQNRLTVLLPLRMDVS